MAHNIKPTVEKIDETVSDLVKSPTMPSSNFDQNTDLIRPTPSLGSITKSEKVSQVTHTPIKEKQAECIVPSTDQPLTSFKLASTFETSDDVNILGMTVTEDNKLLLCNYTDRHEVLLYNDKGQYFSAITMNHKPYDIAEIPGGDQYVVCLSDIRSIQYINRTDLKPGTCVQLQIKSGLRTYGITADKQYIYVSKYNVIFVFKNNGSVVLEIELEGCSIVKYLFVHDNNLYASDRENSIYCINQQQSIRQTEVPGVGTIRKIIVDRQGHIYAGREDSGTVHRLDKDLIHNMTIADKSVKEIGAICFDKNCTKLFVASERGKTIAVFSCT